MTGRNLHRVQLLRSAGWRKPDDAVVIARPTKWGNPFTKQAAIEAGYNFTIDPDTGRERMLDRAEMSALLASIFESWLFKGPESDWWFVGGEERWDTMHRDIWELQDKRLACWCPVNYRCHGDALHALAHRPASRLLDLEPLTT